MERTKYIGRLEKEVLLFGGVYSNLQALEVLMNIVEERNIPSSNIICTGDIVGYCAQPEECVQHIMDWGIHSIAGNVEIQLREGQEDCGCDFQADSRCDIFAKQWYPYARSKVSKRSVSWMQALPEFITFEFGEESCLVVHGSYLRTSEFVFRSTPWEVKARSFEDAGADLIIAGHCGLPFHHLKENRKWLNPGVIGMPANDGTSRVWYMILSEKNGRVSFKHESFEYDFDETFAQMLENELPIAYAQTLSSGLWDNNDILPEEETAAQGRPLVF